MKIAFVGFVSAICAVQSTLTASSRPGHADMTPDTDPSKNIAEESSEFLETIHEILFGDLQASTKNHRTLQDGPNCGALDFPCTHGAVCKPDETKDGADWCFCDVANGYINDPGPDIPIIALYGLQGYRSCVQADECSQISHVCAPGNEGGGCEDRDPENGKYMYFCKEGYLAVLSSIGDHGPEACDQVNECLIFDNICGDGKVCIDTPGSFQCQCEDGLIETQNCDCLVLPVAENLESCDPLSGDDCMEPERECDEELKKCICIPGWIQPAGAGGQCQRQQEVNECEAQTDVACARRGRGGSDPRSKCINSGPLSYETSLKGESHQGYTCECLPPYYDAPNAIRGTNCLEPNPTPAPSQAPVSAVLTAPVPEPASTEPDPPSPALPCTTFVCTAPFSFCAAEQNRCVCQSGYIQSIGSPFACEEICLADTDCLTDEYCFESRCTSCPAGAFRDLPSVDGCVNPCDPATVGDPDPCPTACESSSSTAFTCLCQGSDLDCLQDDRCNTGSGTCEDCPSTMPFRNELSTDGCIDPCNPADPAPPPCRAQCDASSATVVTCVCSTDSDCLQDTDCNLEGGTGACQDCADGFFRTEDSTGGCVNPCQPSVGEPPCPSTCVPSSSTAFTCKCPNNLATECPPDDTCAGGTCVDCPPSTPFRPAGKDHCVECVIDTNCSVDKTCDDSGTCQQCAPDFFRAEDSTGGCVNPCQPSDGEAPCLSTCDSSSATAFTCKCPSSMNTDCNADFECDGGTCEACPMDQIREVTSADDCVLDVPCDPPLCNACDPMSGTPCESGTLNHDIPDGSDTSSDVVVSSEACVITDVDVFLSLEHEWVGDLEISLTHVETGTTTILWGDDGINNFFLPCGASENFHITFDDDGADIPLSPTYTFFPPNPSSCADDLSGTFKPIIQTSSSAFSNLLLSAFNGENAVGVWTLRIIDEHELFEGRVVSWSLIFACM